MDGRERQVFQDGHIREQVKMLEDHAHLAAMEIEIDLFVGDVDAVEPDGAGRRHLKQVQTAQQRRFAGAGRADDGHDLAAVDAEVAVVQGLDGAAVEFLDHVLDADQLVIACRHGASSFRRPRWLCWRGS